MLKHTGTWAVAALCALGLTNSISAQTKKAERITVAWYGGNWGEAFNACVAQPFTKATGIIVVPEIGTSTTTLAKLQQQKNAPSIDVAYLDGGVSELAQSTGVLEGLDPARLKHMEGLIPQAIYRQNQVVYAVSSGYYSLGLTYNTRHVKKPPTSWRDLWQPEFAGAVAVPSSSNSAGVPFVFFLSRVWGTDMQHLAPVYQQLSALDTALLFDSSGAATNAFQSGEALIGAHFSVGTWDMIDKGLPIAFSVPKEGVWATDVRLHLVKNSKNRAAAEAYLDFAMTPPVVACLAAKLYLGPAVKEVKVTPEVARKLPWGEGGSIENLSLFDWNMVNARRAEVTEAWSRENARKR